MSTWRRLGVALFSTTGLMVLGLIYNEVFVAELLPLVDTEAQFATAVVWMENLVPIIIGVLLLATWIWVIAGAVQDERTVDQRRVRR